MTHHRSAREIRRDTDRVEKKLDRQEKHDPKAYRKNDRKFARVASTLRKLSR